MFASPCSLVTHILYQFTLPARPCQPELAPVNQWAWPAQTPWASRWVLAIRRRMAVKTSSPAGRSGPGDGRSGRGHGLRAARSRRQRSGPTTSIQTRQFIRTMYPALSLAAAAARGVWRSTNGQQMPTMAIFYAPRRAVGRAGPLRNGVATHCAALGQDATSSGTAVALRIAPNCPTNRLSIHEGASLCSCGPP